PALAETAEAMRRALDGAGTSPADLAALVLVGGSSRIPLVPQLLSEEFGRDVTVAPDPLGVVAVGAALVAAGQGRTSAAETRRPGRPSPGTGAVAGAVAAAVAGRAVAAPDPVPAAATASALDAGPGAASPAGAPARLAAA